MDLARTGGPRRPRRSRAARRQLDFNRFLAEEAHTRGPSVGLEDGIAQLEELADDFDWALNEECFAYDECDAYDPTVIARDKAVFHAEYGNADCRD